MQISPRATPAEVNKRAASARLPFQIAAMANLDKVPPTGAVIVVTWPKVEHGFGFPARVFAIVP